MPFSLERDDPIGSVPAGSTPVYQSVIVANGTYGGSDIPLPIPGSALNTLTLSIINDATDMIINNRNQVNVLNAGGGSVDETGNLTFFLTAGDTSLIDTPLWTKVLRTLVFDWTYNNHTGSGRHKFSFYVVALGAP